MAKQKTKDNTDIKYNKDGTPRRNPGRKPNPQQVKRPTIKTFGTKKIEFQIDTLTKLKLPLDDKMSKKVKEVKEKKSEFKVDIFEVLKNIDGKNFEYFNMLSEEEKKSLQLYVIMNWLSSCRDNNLTEYYVQMVNSVINKDFFYIANKHPRLILKLMCVIGIGERKIVHTYPKMITSSNKNDKNIKKIFEAAFRTDFCEEEISILEKQFDTKDKKLKLLIDMGLQDAEIKELM